MVEGPLRIAYFGTPAFAVPTFRALLHSRHQVVVLVSQPDRPRGRGQHVVETPTKQVALAAGVPVLQPLKLREEGFLASFASYNVDLGVVAAYGRILPPALLSIPHLGIINVHGSLLPKYRGAAPVHRAIIAGDDVTGVTIMRVVAELDAGAMFSKVTRPIGIDETSVDVEQALAEIGASALVDAVEQLAHGGAIETPQDGARATYAPKLEKSDGPIVWSLSAREVHNRVRGLQPWPMASTSIEGHRYLVHRTALTGQITKALPGTVVDASGDLLTIAAGDGAPVRILVIQPEGRRAMTAREFLSGRKLNPGTIVGTA